MMYAENSLHYWRKLVWKLGLDKERLKTAVDGRHHVALRRDDSRTTRARW